MNLARLQRKMKRKNRKNGCTIGNVISDHPMPIPELGHIYYAYDDGKIKFSREYRVQILGIYKYKQLPKEIKKDWKDKAKNIYWLYAPTTDYFIEAQNIVNDEKQYFVRTHGNGWFALSGIKKGYLDVDGSLYKKAHKLKDALKEMYDF